MKKPLILSSIGRALAVTAAALVLVSGPAAHAEDKPKDKPKDKPAGGKVLAVDSSSITIKTKDGEKKFAVTADTKLTNAEKAAITASDLKPGDRVRITPAADGTTATAVQIAPAKKAEGEGKKPGKAPAEESPAVQE